MAEEINENAKKKRSQKLQSYYFNNLNENIPSTFTKPVSKKNNRKSVVAEINPTSLPEVHFENSFLDIDVSNLDSVITSDVNSLFNKTWEENEQIGLNLINFSVNEDSKYNSDNSDYGNYNNNNNKEQISLNNTLADMIRKAYEQNSFILSSKGNFVCVLCNEDSTKGCKDNCVNKNIMKQMQDDLEYLKELWESADFMLPINEMNENLREFSEHYSEKSGKNLYEDFTKLNLVEKIRYNQDNIRLIEDNYISEEPKFESDTLIGFSRLNQLNLKSITNRQAFALANAFKNTQPTNFEEKVVNDLEVIYEIIRIICMFTS